MRKIAPLASTLLVMSACLALGGSLDAPAPPTDEGSAMFTLDDIYSVLKTRTSEPVKRVSFAEPSDGPTAGTMRTLNELMDMARFVPLQKTGQTTKYSDNDDGDLQLGVAPRGDRFTILDNTNCVLDNLTGLIWARNANIWGQVNWPTAVSNCSELEYGDADDWRLPNVLELFSLIDAHTCQLPSGHPFNNLNLAYYWSSTTYSTTPDSAWAVWTVNSIISRFATSASYYAWPVRGP